MVVQKKSFSDFPQFFLLFAYIVICQGGAIPEGMKKSIETPQNFFHISRGHPNMCGLFSVLQHVKNCGSSDFQSKNG